MVRLQVETKCSGYITLITMLMISAVVVSIVIYGLTTSTLMNKTLDVVIKSDFTKNYADSCVELALQKIRDSTSFTGTGNATFTNGTCTYTVISNGGQNREIRSTGLSGNNTKRVKVIISAINPNIVTDSWKIVDTF